MAKVKSATATDTVENTTNGTVPDSDTVTDVTATTGKKQKELTDQEHKLVETINKMESPVSLPDLNEEFGNPLVCMLAIGTAGKKKFIKLTGMDVSVTAEGLEAYENYVPHERRTREIDPEKAAKREQRLIEKYGDAPDWLKNLEKPTNMEFMQIRLQGALNSVAYNTAVCRMFKFNPTPRENLAKAEAKVAKIQDYITELAKNPAKANALCGTTKAQENDDESDE